MISHSLIDAPKYFYKKTLIENMTNINKRKGADAGFEGHKKKKTQYHFLTIGTGLLYKWYYKDHQETNNRIKRKGHGIIKQSEIEQ